MLSSRPWRDSSAIVTFYTREYGRIRAVAKGGRRSRTSFGSSLELLSRVDIVYHEKEGRELETLSEASLRDRFSELREDLARLAAASYMVQLVDEMVRGREDSHRLFEHLLRGLELIRTGTPVEVAVTHMLVPPSSVHPPCGQ